jgi:hypothetical protein
LLVAWLGSVAATVLTSTSSGATPSARIDYALAYYPAAEGLVMFGGWGPPDWGRLAEMWKLDATGWSLMSTPDAPAMAHHSMAYDSARQRLVVVGQTDDMAAHQGWEFDGSAWTLVTNFPFATTFGDAEVTYDAARQRIVLYWASFGKPVDTWEHDGAKWMQMTPSQLPVATPDGALLKYHDSLQRVVLVGGEPFAGPAQTWLWDGNNWSQVNGIQPVGAVPGGMAYDTARREMVLLSITLRTWTFDGTNWTQRTPTHSPPYNVLGFFSLEYDPVRKVAAFFGGEGPPVYAATWEWDGSDWKEFTSQTAPVRLDIRLESGRNVVVSWPVSATGFVLQAARDLVGVINWQAVSNPPVAIGPQYFVTNSAAIGNEFHRLRKP